MRQVLTFFLLSFGILSFAQTGKGINDQEAADLLKSVSEKYKTYKNTSVSFKLLIQKPKAKPTEDEKRLTDTITGTAIMEGAKFRIDMRGQQTYCDGKNIWTYIPSDKEVQINYYTESEDIFSPTNIFNLYKSGFNYQIKEKKVSGSKKMTVVEMVPQGSFSYFKIDISIETDAGQITETKIYERNGTRYTYRIVKQSTNVSTSSDTFSFDVKKNPGVKVTDLR